MRKFLSILLPVLFPVLFLLYSFSFKEKIEQKKICWVNTQKYNIVIKLCKEGQKVVFLPPTWGNEQIPIIFAGIYCDFRYPVIYNNGGVACIFKAADLPQNNKKK